MAKHQEEGEVARGQYVLLDGRPIPKIK